MAKIFAMDFARRMPSGIRNHVFKRQTHRQELAHHVVHVFHAGVHTCRVNIGGNRVGQKSLLDGRHGDTPREASSTMTDVEDHTPLSRLKHRRVDVAGSIQLVPQSE